MICDHAIPSGRLVTTALLLLVISICQAGEPGEDPEWLRAQGAKGDEAIRLYRELTVKYPGSGAVWHELANACYDKGAWSDALGAYEKAAALEWKLETVLGRIGKCLEKLKRFPEAEAAYRKALVATPHSVPVKFGLATALFNQEKSSEALPLFEEIGQQTGEWGEVAREYLPQLFFDVGKYEAALAAAQGRLARDPKDSSQRWLVARSLLKLKRYREALPLFERVAADEPRRAEAARFYAAVCLEETGQRREAEAVYRELARNDSAWGKEARSTLKKLAGKPYRVFVDYVGGYDTNIVSNSEDGTPIGSKDGFNQIYAAVEGRVYRGERLNIWLGLEHFGLHYLEAHDNDYVQDSARATFNFPAVGPFQTVSLKYELEYAQLDYQPYRKVNRVETSAEYKIGSERLRFGMIYNDATYYRDSKGLSGPDVGFFADYRHELPLWDHQIRVRANAAYRFSQIDSPERFTQRLRLQYRAQIWSIVHSQIEGTYRRDDFPQSQGVDSSGAVLGHRTDHRLSGEVVFDAQIHKNVTVNWGYQYESQDSRRTDQEFGHHLIGAGFTLSY